MTDIRVIDTPLTGGPLTQAALSGLAPAGWYAGAPAGKDEWAARCRHIASMPRPWMKALTPAFGPVGARLVSRVVEAGGIVVTTGQQPGLFGGPWYTWFKAMAARELAAELQKQTGIPAVPVFWAATDDADFAESSTTVIAGREGAERLALTQAPPQGVPMSHALLGDEIEAPLARLIATAGSDQTAPLRAARAAFRAGATIGTAYVELLRTLLEGTGVAVLDASHAAVGESARALLSDALRAGHDLHAALAARQAEIEGNGFDVAVRAERELSLVFAWEPGADGLPRKRRLTLAESRHDAPGVRLSGNVLLRPVVEAQLLPTVAYVAGPGEIAYFAQVGAVAATLGLQAPLAMPRWSGMLVPREVDESMARFGVTIDELREQDAIERRMARAALPPQTAASLAQLRASVDASVAGFDGLLTPAALEGARGQLAHRINRIERRLLAAVKHRDANSLRAISAARGALFPLGEPQERALNALPWLSRYGAELGLAIRSACTQHARRLVSGAPVPA